MAGRLAVDFGTSNTVVTLWNEATREGSSLPICNYARVQDNGPDKTFVIPSLVHFSEDHKTYFGDQIHQMNLYHSPRTFQWMKRYISHRSPVERMIDGRRINYLDAGTAFLTEILSQSCLAAGLTDEEVALTVPVEAFEDYANWLVRVAQNSRMWRYRLIDEPSAAALGYGAEAKPDDIFLVFDFGGGTLDIAIVMMQETASETGMHCRVLGKSGIDLGGTNIDEWLFQELLQRNGLKADDEEVQAIGRLILCECERLKEALSFDESASLTVLNPITGRMIRAEMTRREFEDLLDGHDAFAKIDHTIRRALTAASERGFLEENIKAVLMVGGCSQIPSVQKLLKRIFGKDRIKTDRPLDVVARGASAFVAGMAFHDYIQHDYAIRCVNPMNGRYEYRPLIRRGTRYPSQEVVASITVKASFDGQDKLGIPLFEMGGNIGSFREQRLELFFDDSGAARLQTVAESEVTRRNYFWINENNPTFLRADPAAKRGEPRFKLEFQIDGNRRLLFTAVDIITNDVIFRDYPVARLI